MNRLIYFLFPILNLIVAQVYAQKGILTSKKTFIPCDTIVLKNGSIQLGKMAKTNANYYFFRDCNEYLEYPNRKSALLSTHKNNVDTVKIGTIKTLKYEYVPTQRKLFVDATIGLSVPFMNAFLFRAIRNIEISPIDIQTSISLCYQFNRYSGVGVTFKNNLLYDYSIAQIGSYLADYRIQLDQNVLIGHFGMLGYGSKIGSEYCDVRIDRSRFIPVYGVSYKRLSLKNLISGASITTTKIPINQYCALPNGMPSTVQRKTQYLSFNVFLGFYLPRSFKKELIQ